MNTENAAYSSKDQLAENIRQIRHVIRASEKHEEHGGGYTGKLRDIVKRMEELLEKLHQ